MIRFPDQFIFGTSTAAAQIETAADHDWAGIRALDGSVFQRTTDHELRWASDAEIISELAPAYRMSLLWSRLQKGPYQQLNGEAVSYYIRFIENLKGRGVKIMLVLHHFENPVWFSNMGGWSKSECVNLWLDYVRKVVNTFGRFISYWNTFNEPNLYLSMGYLSGQFPPNKRNPFLAFRTLKHISESHREAYLIIKTEFPDSLVGLSHNSAILEADSFLGNVPAAITDWWYMDFIPGWYGACDFFGFSYYARIGYNPWPVTQLYSPDRIAKKKKPHDQMWEYYPQGISQIMKRYWEMFRKPIMITENGVATMDDNFRIQAIHDYLTEIHSAMSSGIPCLGYFHWSTWDNFEWNLGRSFRFGLYEVNYETMERKPRPSAAYYASIAHQKILLPPYATALNAS